MVNNESKQLGNVKLYWAYLATPNNSGKFPSNKYQVDVGGLSDTQVEYLESQGVSVKEKGDERGKYITARSKFLPTVVGKDTKPFEDVETIGNGTVANVIIHVYKTSQGHVGVGLNGVQVLDLVKFETGASMFEAVNDNLELEE